MRILPKATLLLLLSAVLPTLARADRNILTPTGLIVPFKSIKAEYLTQTDRDPASIGWVATGLPLNETNVELEVERSFIPNGLHRETFSLQYSPFGNLLTGQAAAVSVGMRDVLNRGRSGRALFAAATRTLSLSRGQEKLFRDVKIHVGIGTNRLDGPFLGFQTKFRAGFSLNAEYTSRHANVSLSVPAVRYIQLKAANIEGRMFYGASFSLSR